MPELIEFISQFLVDCVSKLSERGKHQKEAMAEYLANIADTLSKFGPAYKKQNIEEMTELISQTDTFAQNFRNVVEGIFRIDEINNFVIQLQNAVSYKDILRQKDIMRQKAAAGGEIDTVTPLNDEQLYAIAEISGVFRANSVNLKAKADRM